MDTINIILSLLGGVGIVAVGAVLTFGGALGNNTALYISGMGLYLFGVFTTAMTFFINVFGADPVNNHAIYFLSIGIALFIGVAHWRKFFLNKRKN